MKLPTVLQTHPVEMLACGVMLISFFATIIKPPTQAIWNSVEVNERLNRELQTKNIEIAKLKSDLRMNEESNRSLQKTIDGLAALLEKEKRNSASLTETLETVRQQQQQVVVQQSAPSSAAELETSYQV